MMKITSSPTTAYLATYMKAVRTIVGLVVWTVVALLNISDNTLTVWHVRFQKFKSLL